VTSFFINVYAWLGRTRSASAVRTQVDAMFALLDTDRNGLLNLPEFLDVAGETKFHLGETLTEFIDGVTERFVESVEPVAVDLQGGRAK
jgi:Ca2+-binding EF-hand superfamily protein